MESFNSETFGNSKVTFYGVASTYPSVSFYFSFPAQYKAEAGDWIAMYPVGWSNLGSDYIVKKVVKPDSLWNGIYGGDKLVGSMEFEVSDWTQSPYSSIVATTKFAKDQYYQLVYVKNGEWVLGMSKPFSLYTSSMFGSGVTDYPFYKSTYPITPIEGAETGLFNGSYASALMTPYGSEFVVEPQWEKQLQQLIGGLFNIEQSITGYKNVSVYSPSFTGVDAYFKAGFDEVYGKFSTTETLVDQVVMPHQLHKHWMTRLGEMEHMLIEQFKIEQAQRRIDQTHVLAQLKTYERYIYYLVKNEQTVNEYMRNIKLATKLAEFKQKCYEVVKTHSLVEQPEYYIQKYEQLLKEKIELEIVERAKYLPKLRQLVKECLEFKLREIQRMEHQYYTRFYKLIKTKFGMWESKYFEPVVGQFIGSKPEQSFLYEAKMDYELRQQLKYLISQFYTEQVKELYQLIKLNKQLGWLCGEVGSKLYQFEWTYGAEMYAQMKFAPELKPIMLISAALYPFYPSLVGYPINSTFAEEDAYFGGEYDAFKKLVQMEQILFQIRGTFKSTLFPTFQDKYSGSEIWSPIEFYIQSGYHSVWKHLQMLERKIVYLKGIWLEKQLKSYLIQRLTEFEVAPTFSTKFGSKIKFLKSMYNKHYQLPTYEAYWPAYNHYLFTTPESFVQHHEQFDKLWTLFNEFEFETVWGEQAGIGSYYTSPYEGFSTEYPYLASPSFAKFNSGSKYSTYGYPTSYAGAKYDNYPATYYGGIFGNESFKSYKPYFGRSGVFATSYTPLTTGKMFGSELNPIETVIGELEGELTKLKVQKEWPYEFATPSIPYTPTTYFPTSTSTFF